MNRGKSFFEKMDFEGKVSALLIDFLITDSLTGSG
jgi:hypothetical protein